MYIQKVGLKNFRSFGDEGICFVSTLSQILQTRVPKRYYLSPKACLGILRRASVRGKELPPVLKAALERQAAVEQEDGSV